MNKTNIEWVKNPDGTQGWTWNPITGCLNGCEYCYARKLANGRLRSRYLANNSVASKEDYFLNHGYYGNPFYPRLWPERLNELTTWIDNLTPIEAYRGLKAPNSKGIFVCDMGELFGNWIPKHWQQQIFNVIQANSQHRFYLLTKQPQNLIKFSPFPGNCWVGVTATNKQMFNRAIIHLSGIEAKIKYLSVEPMLDDVLAGEDIVRVASILSCAGINLVIIGACTGKKRELLNLLNTPIGEKICDLKLVHWKHNIWTVQPKIQWVREIVEACDKAGISVFLKNNLRPLIPERQKPFWYVNHFESHLRQEMPVEHSKL